MNPRMTFGILAGMLIATASASAQQPPAPDLAALGRDLQSVMGAASSADASAIGLNEKVRALAQEYVAQQRQLQAAGAKAAATARYWAPVWAALVAAKHAAAPVAGMLIRHGVIPQPLNK